MSKLKKALVPYYIALKETRRNIRLYKNKEFEAAALEAQIIKYLHAIEKGLCLEKPRLGYGVKKINEMFELVSRYTLIQACDQFCLYMVRDAVEAYLKFHEDNHFTNEDIKSIHQRLNELEAILSEDKSVYGGFLNVETESMDFCIDEIEKFIKTRHSVREFSGEKVSDDDIKKAIMLAQYCPSACNRQCTRLYSVSRDKFLKDINTDLQGIGGFADATDKFLLVTAKQTAYSLAERNQYIVSAGIFAGYLSLTLHAYDIASCVVQRSVTPNEQWDNFRRLNGIPEDEQIVVMFALGTYKQYTKAPVSKRFPIQKIYKSLD